ncbi:MAG: hypothetical protein QF578_12930 [Alphaproteobacteria bacterium]|nr:hypothetical protein [Alphaproteobacteria bacterium]MDP6815733.1 hypothetical protein [Alphaproteobacteria bacterium]
MITASYRRRLVLQAAGELSHGMAPLARHGYRNIYETLLAQALPPSPLPFRAGGHGFGLKQIICRYM